MLKNILPQIFLMGRERGKSNVTYNDKNIIINYYCWYYYYDLDYV